MATLTYVYADSTAVLGPLATQAEPHSYDLCVEHATRLTVPRGWDVVRIVPEFEPAPTPEDDVTALADAVQTGPPRRRDGFDEGRGTDDPGFASRMSAHPASQRPPHLHVVPPRS